MRQFWQTYRGNGEFIGWFYYWSLDLSKSFSTLPFLMYESKILVKRMYDKRKGVIKRHQTKWRITSMTIRMQATNRNFRFVSALA